MRSLQSALERHDASITGARQIGRNDWRCLQWLVEEGAQSPRAIQRRLGLTSGSVTALLDRLERRGLIARVADPADRRALRIEPVGDAQRWVEEAALPLDLLIQKLTARWGTDRSAATGQACLDLAKLVEWAAQRA